MDCPECARLKSELESAEVTLSAILKELSVDRAGMSHNFYMQMRTAEHDIMVELEQITNQIRHHQAGCEISKVRIAAIVGR
jgi:hypothetical protein